MRAKLRGSISEADIIQLQSTWEAEGYVFSGNGFLDRDDPVECPSCGEPGYFYALWKHPTKKTEVMGDDGIPYTLSAIHVFNRCYECGYQWVDGDDND